MPEPSAGLLRLVRKIDWFTDSTGIWIASLSLPLVAAVSWEVIARYRFGTPTVWAFDVTYMLYATLFMLGSAYALHKGAHIRTDFLSEHWSGSSRHHRFGLIHRVLLPGVHRVPGGERNQAFYAWTINETSEQTPWRPLLWPFKLVLPWPGCCCWSKGYPRRSRACGRRALGSSSNTKKRWKYEPGSRGPGALRRGCDPGECFQPPTRRAWTLRRCCLRRGVTCPGSRFSA